MVQVHGTCVAVAGLGVLLRGPAGSGKSDLALRLIDGGARLVADDRVDLERRAEQVIATSPEVLAGRLEIRGVGILSVPAAESVPLYLICDLVPPQNVERLPSRDTEVVEGVTLYRLQLAPFEASAAAKLRLTARTLGRGILPDDEHR